MSNRFDDMMVQGINTNDATASALDILQGKTAYANGQKITGTLVPGGSGDDLNIYVQNSVPATPKGVWIKDSANGEKYLKAFYAKQGDFGSEVAVTNLVTSDDIIGQVIVGDYLYSFGTSSATSYKYDLRNKQLVGNINVPTISIATTNRRFRCCI